MDADDLRRINIAIQKILVIMWVHNLDNLEDTCLTKTKI